MKNNLFFDNFGTDVKKPEGFFEFNKTTFDELVEKLDLDDYGNFSKLEHQLYFDYSDLKCSLCNTHFLYKQYSGRNTSYSRFHMLHISIPLKYEISDEIRIGLYGGKVEELVHNFWRKIISKFWKLKKDAPKIQFENKEFNDVFWVKANNSNDAKRIINNEFQDFLLHMKDYATESKKRYCKWWEKPFFKLMEEGNVLVLVKKDQIIFTIYGLKRSLIYMINNLCHNRMIRTNVIVKKDIEYYFKKIITYVKRSWNEYDVDDLNDDQLRELDQNFKKEFKFLTILIDELKRIKNT